MKCTACGFDNDADAGFCENCGETLTHTCAACGSALKPGARFCKKCGTSVARPAAAAEINQRMFEESGDLQPAGRTWANARAFASMNNGYLAQFGVHAMVTGISVNAGSDTVLVKVSANVERLFPSVVPNIFVTERGEAKIRAFTQ